MDNITELLKIDFKKAYDTPKRLNRSESDIPIEVIDKLESGVFTSEMVDTLAGSYPIYRYRTQITIHGNWNYTGSGRIGVYSNVFKNQNESLGVKYSAIDRGKIKDIVNCLRLIKSGFGFTERSNERHFYYRETFNKETFVEKKLRFEGIVSLLQDCKAYGSVCLFIYSVYGIFYIEININLMAIYENDKDEFCLIMFNSLLPQFSRIANLSDFQEYKSKCHVEADKRELELKVKYELEAQERKIKSDELSEKIRIKKEVLKELPECNDITQGVLVSVKFEQGTNYSTSSDGNIKFIYYKSEKGSFGRFKLLRAVSDEFEPDTDKLEFKDNGEKKLKDINIKGCYLCKKNTREVTINTVKPVDNGIKEIKVEGISIINYSDKAIAVIGNTKPIKDSLRLAGGRFNPRLTCGAGWIFSKIHESKVRSLVSI